MAERKARRIMKIVHTTHDTAAGRPTRRPHSATQRIKDYFSIRIHGPSPSGKDDEEALIQPDPNIRERRASETHVGRRPGNYAILIKEHKELKRKQREKRMYEAADVRLERAYEKASANARNQNSGKKLVKSGKATYGHLQELNSSAEIRKAPNLKRMKGFEDFSDAKTQADTGKKAQGDEYLSQMRSQRQAINEGNLEKTIPPSSSSQKPELNSGHRYASKGITKHSKSASTSSKLSSYMGTSADLLDATRRDLTSNLRKSVEKAERVLSSKFDQFGRYSSGHGNDWGDESDSDESFFCIGENQLSQLDRARCLSGDGTSPWTDGPQEECRLCRKSRPAGVRGLCLDCEHEFRRPKTTVLEESDDEVKPPPPLKIKKKMAVSTCAQVMGGNIPNPFSDEEFLAPKINQVDKKPQFVTPSSHISQQVYIDEGSHTPESGSEYMSRYASWQSTDLRTRYRDQENEDSTWSSHLMNDNQACTTTPTLRSKFSNFRRSTAVDEETFPLVAEDNKASNKTRRAKSKGVRESYNSGWQRGLNEAEAEISSFVMPDKRYAKIR